MCGKVGSGGRGGGASGPRANISPYKQGLSVFLVPSSFTIQADFVVIVPVEQQNDLHVLVS